MQLAEHLEEAFGALPLQASGHGASEGLWSAA